MNARDYSTREHQKLTSVVYPSDKRRRLELFEVRRLMRVAFYAEIDRSPPSSISHMPGYVRAVKKHWQLKYNNSARALLAEIEGFPSWEEMMKLADDEEES